jgi:Cdc6-like AAA superfamily ATPase
MDYFGGRHRRLLMSNPFYPPGSPLPMELLVGRDTEIAIAFDSINKCSRLAIYGSSGIGKSVFLKYLASEEVWQNRGLDYTKALIVLINCQGIYPFNPSQFWREVLTLLKE